MSRRDRERGTDTVMTNNVAKKNKIDCTNQASTRAATFAAGSPAGNSCADGSGFTVDETGMDEQVADETT